MGAMSDTPRSELKRITVLFSDMSGYTALAEKLHPEDIAEIIASVLAGVSKIVTARGGRIEKFIGDEVMAVFGSSIVQEDDAAQAIRTALDIHAFVDALAPTFSGGHSHKIAMHTGINTGLVLAAEADMKRGIEGVLGDTVNLAARLTSLAKSGEIVVGEGTYRMAEADFEFEALPPAVLKGKERPVQAYRVACPIERQTLVHRLTGLQSRLVGRDRELQALDAAVSQLKQGFGGAVCVSGDAGTGKSRLIAEFQARLDDVRWLEGRSYPRSQDVSYFTFIDLLARAWGIADGEASESAGIKLHAGLQTLGTRDELEPFVRALFGMDSPELAGVEPQRQKSQTERSIIEALADFAKRGPTVVHLEDLHWADRSSLDLLCRLLSEPQYPLLLLLTTRPGTAVEAKLRDAGQVDLMSLPELTEEQSLEMLVSLLGGGGVPELVTSCTARAN